MVFFTSDLHLDHKNILIYEAAARPFAHVDEMNEALVSNWNAIVSSEDTVYVLGDFSLSSKAVFKYAPRLNGHKILVPGNHDDCFPWTRTGEPKKNAQRLKEAYVGCGFEVLYPAKPNEVIVLETLGVTVSHFPLRGTDKEDEVRYSWARPIRTTDLLHVHGHVHSKWKFDKNRNQLNVGVDVWDLKPVSIDEIKRLCS